MISHDVALLDDVCNKVWFLDAVRAEADVYNMGFSTYQKARAEDEARRRRERANAEKKASALQKQAAKLGAKATKAAAAKQMLARAERMINELDEVRVADKFAAISFPDPAPCGKTPLYGKGLTKMYGSLEVFAGVDLAVDKGSRVVVLGTNGAGKTTLLKLLAGVERTDGEGGLVTGHGLKIGYFAQEHDPSTAKKPSGRIRSKRARTRASRIFAVCLGRSCFPAISSNSPLAPYRVVRRHVSRWRRLFHPGRMFCC